MATFFPNGTSPRLHSSCLDRTARMSASNSSHILKLSTTLAPIINLFWGINTKRCRQASYHKIVSLRVGLSLRNCAPAIDPNDSVHPLSAQTGRAFSGHSAEIFQKRAYKFHGKYLSKSFRGYTAVGTRTRAAIDHGTASHVRWFQLLADLRSSE